ncbi:MAG: hypothetical protein KAY24_01045 [Candidatus Eisenbacteria sp.]|nr:hypothetical protein [Candidatus Eisenbacteria bacterium]
MKECKNCGGTGSWHDGIRYRNCPSCGGTAKSDLAISGEQIFNDEIDSAIGREELFVTIPLCYAWEIREKLTGERKVRDELERHAKEAAGQVDYACDCHRRIKNQRHDRDVRIEKYGKDYGALAIEVRQLRERLRGIEEACQTVTDGVPCECFESSDRLGIKRDRDCAHCCAVEDLGLLLEVGPLPNAARERLREFETLARAVEKARAEWAETSKIMPTDEMLNALADLAAALPRACQTCGGTGKLQQGYCYDNCGACEICMGEAEEYDCPDCAGSEDSQ